MHDNQKTAGAGLSFPPALAATGDGGAGPSSSVAPKGRKDLWTPERDALLKSLWNKSHTARQIWTMMGITKGSLMGRSRRLGLLFRDISSQTPGFFQKVKAAKERKTPKVLPKSAATDALVEETPDNTRDPKGCRFIFGHVREARRWRYCQAATVEKRDYCAEHLALIYRPALPPGSKSNGPGTAAWYATQTNKGGRIAGGRA